MDVINILSLSIFLVFFISYLLKLIILNRKNGIKANVLGKGGKSKDINKAELFVKITTFTWGALWFILSIMGSKVNGIIGLITNTYLLRYIGVAFLAIGCFLFIIAMVSMKTSWRVGIDKKTHSSLVTNGIYKYSRNPAFVGFDTMFLGFSLTNLSLLTLIVTVLNIIAIHRLIIQEEQHLYSIFGDGYAEYKAKTPRYFLK
ncbi:MAG: isoprenylcysteine carboxylmethyltransferase family protein [Bacillota bacterium]|nr:isoprenylcysteine carboxylmethyltransferase family protein [Bacillota bacterium]